jgi:leader peptidase (prepilin peptidase)/N-methyltransferase
LPVYLALCLLGVLLAAIDLASLRLPDILVLPAIGATLAALTAVAGLTGAWSALRRGLLGGLVLGTVFLLLHLVPGGGLGFGDVKVAALLGLALGYVGWRAVVLGALLPWLLNAPVAISLLAARRVGRRTALPFGPALLTGAATALVVSAWVDVVGRTG